MIQLDDRIDKDDIVRPDLTTRLAIPFFANYIQAGFPSPADNYIEKVCDLNDLCITNPEATIFVRVGSDSMIGDRIDKGDILVVDCARQPTEGKIVVVWLNSDHAVKRIHYAGELVVLLSSNPKYDPIYVQPGESFRVVGVVTYVLYKPR